jgi:uncharacterized protein YdaU (DUF1376 family)
MNYYERHLGDYAKDTVALSMAEHGAYNLLLDRYYGTEAGIPADEVYRVAKATTKPERTAVNFVLKSFFKRVGDVWVKARCDLEIARFHEKQDKARKSANARWHPCERNANASETHMPSECSPVPSPQSPVLRKESEAKNGLPREEVREIEAFSRSFAGSHQVPRA